MEYDLCIVGAGMFGSSAASHAPQHLNICIVGPEEPKGKPQRDILGSHYDEGRIVDICLQLETMALTKASMERFRRLEQSTGIFFYDPVGFLYITNNMEEIDTLKSKMERLSSTSVTDLSNPTDFAEKFPFLHLEPDEGALYEQGGAGHISPRKFVEAQLKSAGCKVFRDVVRKLSKTGTGQGCWLLDLESGESIRAHRVLLCTGAFTHLRPELVPCPLPPFCAVQETVAMLEVSQEEAERLSGMPSMVYDRKPAHAYILPPILYPNGRWYLKIGHGKQYFKEMKTSKEFLKWYQKGGDPEIAEELTRLLLHLIPGLRYQSSTPNSCVTSHSPSGLPYIDLLEPTLGVALVGNGCSAKMADQVGKLAVELLATGKWDSTLVSREQYCLPADL